MSDKMNVYLMKDGILLKNTSEHVFPLKKEYKLEKSSYKIIENYKFSDQVENPIIKKKIEDIKEKVKNNNDVYFNSESEAAKVFSGAATVNAFLFFDIMIENEVIQSPYKHFKSFFGKTRRKLGERGKKFKSLLQDEGEFEKFKKFLKDKDKNESSLISYIFNEKFLWKRYDIYIEKQELYQSIDEETLSKYIEFLKTEYPKFKSKKRIPNEKEDELDEVSDSKNISEQKKAKIILEQEQKHKKHPIFKIIENRKSDQIVLTGAPGTGKTFMAKKYAEIKTEGNNERFEIVQFHPSFDYTDFVEGIRPVEDKNGNLTFVKRDGIFKIFCRKAYKKNEKYYFIIDEINRTDLSKVFGELMYCLESTYKDESDKIKTQYHNLKTNELDLKGYDEDIFEDGFFIPKNVVIIGTMNNIDRSVESFDFALRRRFNWINIKVDENLLESTFSSMYNIEKNDNFLKTLVERIINLNNTISKSGASLGLDKNYWIGPAYFKKNKNDNLGIEDFLEKKWNENINPLLREYVRGRNKKSCETFILKCKEELLLKK